MMYVQARHDEIKLSTTMRCKQAYAKGLRLHARTPTASPRQSRETTIHTDRVLSHLHCRPPKSYSGLCVRGNIDGQPRPYFRQHHSCLPCNQGASQSTLSVGQSNKEHPTPRCSQHHICVTSGDVVPTAVHANSEERWCRLWKFPPEMTLLAPCLAVLLGWAAAASVALADVGRPTGAAATE